MDITNEFTATDRCFEDIAPFTLTASDILSQISRMDDLISKVFVDYVNFHRLK